MQELDKDNLKPQAKTILIVEDDVVNVRVFCKVISKYSDLNVKHTEDVEEILRIAQAGEADLVLMDISVSLRDYEGKEVDSLDITKMLKSHPLTTNVPVILITANFLPGTSTLSVMEESGANFCIPKPIINHQIFVDQIRMFL
jgi:CheY-like chemotaxis protein